MLSPRSFLLARPPTSNTTTTATKTNPRTPATDRRKDELQRGQLQSRTGASSRNSTSDDGARPANAAAQATTSTLFISGTSASAKPVGVANTAAASSTTVAGPLTSAANMARRKDGSASSSSPRASLAPSAASPVTSSSSSTARPTTPTSPVEIPAKSRAHYLQQTPASKQRGGNGARQRARPRDVRSPNDAIPASVAALLAITAIPPQRSGGGGGGGARNGSLRGNQRSANNKHGRMTVDSIIERAHVAEKELSLTLGGGGVLADEDPAEETTPPSRNPNAMEILLSPPDDDEEEEEDEDDEECLAAEDGDSNDGDISVASDGCCGALDSASVLSTRTVSLESMPSLDESSFTNDTLSSLESPSTPSSMMLSPAAAASLAAAMAAVSGGGGGGRGAAARMKRRSNNGPKRAPSASRLLTTRRGLEPISSPPGEREDHPLSESDFDLDLDDDLEFGSFTRRQSSKLVTAVRPAASRSKRDSSATVVLIEEKDSSGESDSRSSHSHSDDSHADAHTNSPPSPPSSSLGQAMRSAFKSNLTASIRALRLAARSISALNFPSIPPDDLLTRSILTIDPRVPFTDERRPPVAFGEALPSDAVRRYLNPDTRPSEATATASAALLLPNATPSATLFAVRSSTAVLVAPTPLSPAAVAARGFTASIQMQTYRIQKYPRPSPTPPPSSSSGAPPSSTSSTPTAGPSRPASPRNLPSPSPSTTTITTTTSTSSSATTTQNGKPLPFLVPGRHTREVRENGDFIRVAVLEMAMRRARKFADSAPGRARWLLPPREMQTRPYEVGPDGVPRRWVAVSAEEGV